MFSRHVPMVCLAGSIALFVALPTVAQQDKVDKDAYSRDQIQFLTTELDQWTKDFPHQFYTALMKPPLDASKLSDSEKGGADELGAAVKQLYALSSAKDVVSSSKFKDQLDKTLLAAKPVNDAMSKLRFPDPLITDWEQVRSNLNTLAQYYKVETLAILDPLAPVGGGRGGWGGRGAAAPTEVAKAVAPGAGVTGYIVDQRCALRGKGMWTNVQCIETCLRDGDTVVIVTEEGKVFRIGNPDKITPETYGQKVTLLGKTEADVITISALQ